MKLSTPETIPLLNLLLSYSEHSNSNNNGNRHLLTTYYYTTDNQQQQTHTDTTHNNNNTFQLSSILGWLYFLAWSASFYPQIILNYKRKSARGLSSDFLLLNLLGFSCLTMYDIAIMYVTRVKQDEKLRNHGDEIILVHVNDLAFALHALILTIGCCLQSIYYGDALPITKPCKLGVIGVLFLILFGSIESLTRNIHWDPSKSFWGHNAFTALGFFQNLSFIKIGVTLIKYTPQLLFNYQRKSTEGWSIGNIILDFSGGILSFLQLFIDAINSHDIWLITENPVKLALSLVSLFYDCLFLLQHYVWFRKSSSNNNSVLDTPTDETDEEQHNILNDINNDDDT
jgi:cystinosin